jgi:hypothetical protein
MITADAVAQLTLNNVGFVGELGSRTTKGLLLVGIGTRL